MAREVFDLRDGSVFLIPQSCRNMEGFFAKGTFVHPEVSVPSQTNLQMSSSGGMKSMEAFRFPIFLRFQ